MNPLDWYRWLRAQLIFLVVDHFERKKMRAGFEYDGEILPIAEDAIRKYSPQSEILTNDRGVYYCESCKGREGILVKKPTNHPLVCDFLCVGCFLGRLAEETK